MGPVRVVECDDDAAALTEALKGEAVTTSRYWRANGLWRPSRRSTRRANLPHSDQGVVIASRLAARGNCSGKTLDAS
jgi:hypothetical protein